MNEAAREWIMRWVAVLVFVVMTLLINQSWAETRRDRGPDSVRERSRTTEPLAGGRGVKEDIFRQLLSAETQSLSWPAFPRIWIERSLQNWHSSNTSLGINVPMIDTGAKLSLGFRYALKTSFVMISSLRANSDTQSEPITDSIRLVNGLANADESKLEASIVRWDENQNVAYPKLRSGYPMIGFCAFEASLVMDKTGKAEFDAIAVGQTFETGETETIQQILFSNFFQIRGDVSIRTYLEDVCGKIFREQVEPSVVNDFSKMVVEKVLWKNTEHQCQPTPASDRLSAEMGDASCLDWYKSTVAGATRKMTVPRCLLQKDGAYRCQLRAKQGVSCPLYKDHNSVKLTESQNTRRAVRVAGGYHEFPCDKTKKLKCQMMSQPWMLLGHPFAAGSARCLPSSPPRSR